MPWYKRRSWFRQSIMGLMILSTVGEVSYLDEFV